MLDQGRSDGSNDVHPDTARSQDRRLRSPRRLGLAVAVTLAVTAGCSNQPAHGAGSAASSPAQPPPAAMPLTVADGSLRLISAYVPAAAAGQPVYLDATIDNVDPNPVQLKAVTIDSGAATTTGFRPVNIPGYAHTSLTGQHRLRIATATKKLTRGQRLSVTLHIGPTDITADLPIE